MEENSKDSSHDEVAYETKRNQEKERRNCPRTHLKKNEP